MICEPTAVYLIHNTWSVANYKVGKTRNIPRRIAEIEEQYGVDARLIASCWFPTKKAAEAAEKIWHKILGQFFTDDHTGKEWFALPSAQIDQFIEWTKLSLPKTELLKWIYSGTPNNESIRTFQDVLFNGLPRRQRHQLIDVWTNPHYQLNSNVLQPLQ